VYSCQQKLILRYKKEDAKGLRSLLEIVGFEMTTKSISACTYMKSWMERVSYFRSCMVETADAK